MLTEKSLRILLIGFAALISAFFSIKAVSVFWVNHSLKMQVPAIVSQWEVKEIKSNRYQVIANYYFELNGRTYRGIAQFCDSYLNSISAIAGLKVMAKQEWMVWIDPDNPSSSCLEKKPFLGLAIRAFISLLVLVYFIFNLYKKYFKLDLFFIK